MAGNDVFLYSVPSDASSNDVRLRDPTQASTPAFVLAASEGPDVLAFFVQEGFVLAASEAADIAAFNVQEGFRLAATEGADTAAFLIQEGFRLAASEAADSAAFVLVEGANLDLVASEGADTAAFSLQEGFRFSATEASDIAAFSIDAAVTPNFDLAASEGADQASLAMDGPSAEPERVNQGAGGAWIKVSDDGVISLRARDVRLPRIRVGKPVLRPHPVFRVSGIRLEIKVGTPRLVRNDANEVLDIISLISLIDLIGKKAA